MPSPRPHRQGDAYRHRGSGCEAKIEEGQAKNTGTYCTLLSSENPVNLIDLSIIPSRLEIADIHTLTRACLKDMPASEIQATFWSTLRGDILYMLPAVFLVVAT